MNLIKMKNKFSSLHENESGKIGYIIAWLLGIPASVLILIFLVRGN